MQYQPPPNINYGPKVNLEPEIQEQDKKIKLLTKIVELDIGLNLFVFGFLLFIALFVFFWRFDLLDYFQKKQGLANNSNSTQNSSPAPLAMVSSKGLSSPKPDIESIYINQQGLNIDNVFKIPGDNIKVTVSGQFKKQTFGFLPYWVISKTDEIDIKPYTDISFFGLEMDGDGNIIKNDSTNKSVAAWSKFYQDPATDKFIKKAKQNRTKVYITLKCFNQDNIIKLSTNDKSRQNFITNALFLMNSKALDGLNIDFEYIGTPDKKVIDGFSILISQLNKELKRQYPNSLLSVDTFVDAATNTRIHDIPVLAENSDALVIMAYDFHTPQSSITGSVAPMEGSGYSLKTFINDYIEKAGSNKLILAVPHYGYDWPVEKVGQNAQVKGNVADVKILSYAEISEISKNTRISWDEKSQTPWFSYTDASTKIQRVVHYENLRSLGIKYDFVNEKNLKGVGIWAMGFNGKRHDLDQLLVDKFAY